MWDDGGRRYLDARRRSGTPTSATAGDEIADAVAAKCGRWTHTASSAISRNEPALELADRLAALAPAAGRRVFLGSRRRRHDRDRGEARAQLHVRAASRERVHLIARRRVPRHPRLRDALGGIDANASGFGPLVAAASAVPHDAARRSRRRSCASAPDGWRRSSASRSSAPAACHLPPAGYIEGVAEICAEPRGPVRGRLVICGFGRLGTWFGIERWPGATGPDRLRQGRHERLPARRRRRRLRRRRRAVLRRRPAAPMLRHGATYAGHPACCAAALADARHLRARGTDRARPRRWRGRCAPRSRRSRPPAGQRGARRARLAGRGRAADDAARADAGAVARSPPVRARPACSSARCSARRRGVAAADLRGGAHRPDRPSSSPPGSTRVTAG